MACCERNSLGGMCSCGTAQSVPPMGSERSATEEAVARLETQKGGTLDQSDSLLVQEAVVAAVLDTCLSEFLAGNVTPKGIEETTGFDLKMVRDVLNSVHFAKLVREAQRNLTQSAIERLERNVHRNLKILEDLTLNKDPRVRMEAARDQLNRTPGLQPGARVELGVAAYKKIVDKYVEIDADTEDQTP